MDASGSISELGIYGGIESIQQHSMEDLLRILSYSKNLYDIVNGGNVGALVNVLKNVCFQEVETFKCKG